MTVGIQEAGGAEGYRRSGSWVEGIGVGVWPIDVCSPIQRLSCHPGCEHSGRNWF